MSLLYKQNLLNQSLWNLSRVPSPLCSYCSQEEETAEHLLFTCNEVDQQLRTDVTSSYRRALVLINEEMEPDSYIGLVNASRDVKFVSDCLNIIRGLDVRVTFEL